MIFYVALAIACLIAAIIALWLFRSLLELGRSTVTRIMPSKRDEAKRARFMHLNPDLKDARSPWGWSGDGGARHANLHRAAAKQRPAGAVATTPEGKSVPWGWPGTDGLKKSNRDLITRGIENSPAVSGMRHLMAREEQGQKAAVGWPYRAEKPQKRRTRARPTTRISAKPAKPWGW